MLINPQSLVSKLYKARYFWQNSILEANIGSNPSFIWRSIHAAKVLVGKGVRWMIGTGENVRIKGQPWLLDKQNLCVTSESTVLKHNFV